MRKSFGAAVAQLETVTGFTSGEEKIAKPDPAIFALACRRAGFGPGELLFVDDSVVNIAAARALGFHVHLFADPDHLEPATRLFDRGSGRL